MVLEKTLESPLDCKEIQPVHSEGDQPWDFFGRTDSKAETLSVMPNVAPPLLISQAWPRDEGKLQYFGHLMGRTDSLEKTLMLGKIEGKRRRE